MKKYCENCGKELIEGADICTNCGKLVNNNSNNKPKTKITWWMILIIVFAVVSTFVFFGITFFVTLETIQQNENDYNNILDDFFDDDNEDNNMEYKFNKLFEFDDLEITISDNITFTKLVNQYSEHNNEDVIKVPVTIKNIDDDDNFLNMFYINYFGSSRSELDNVSTYFNKDCVEFAGQLQPGASYTKYFYFLYDGDGTYTIKLDNWSEEINFNLNIEK